MDYSFIDNELKKKIETTKFVFLVARPGTGKTFSGDYLESVRGWKHIDGDIPVKQMATNPEWFEASSKMFGFGEYEGKTDFFDGILDHSKAYFDILARLTLEAARESNTVVMTHATYFRVVRDYFRKLLVDGGAKDVSTVFLKCDPEPHAKALWERINRQARDSGIPLSTLLEMWGAKLNEETLEDFTRWFIEKSTVYSAFEEVEEAEQPYTLINNTAKDATVLDRLDEVFGIDPNKPRCEGTYEEMIEAIKAVDAKRDEAMYEFQRELFEAEAEKNNDEEAKAELEEMAKTEPKKLAARRSSLLDAAKAGSLRRMSSLSKSGESGRSSTRGSLLLAGKRRSSFLVLGKFENDDEEDEVP
jgi:hypothetical protein